MLFNPLLFIFTILHTSINNKIKLMKYLNLYKTELDYNTNFKQEDYNVSYIDGVGVKFDKRANSYKTTKLSVTIPEGTDPNLVNVSIAPLKYNKRFAFNYSVDDNNMQTYSVVEKLYQGKYIDDAEFVHMGDPDRTTGYTPETPLYYTDGFGNRRYFTMGNYLIYKFIRTNPGKTNPYLTIDELKYLQDFDCDWMIHNVDEDKWGKTDPELMSLGMIEFNDLMESHKVGRSILSSHPDGNDAYSEAGKVCPEIYSYIDGTVYVDKWVDTISIPNLYKLPIPRKFMNFATSEYTYDLLEEVQSGSVLGKTALWSSIGTHRPRGKDDQTYWDYLSEFLTYIYKTYGAAGSDEVWFAQDKEVYEYLYLNSLTTIDKKVNGNKLDIELKIPDIPNFQWYMTTLLLSSGESVEVDDKVTNVSYGMKGDNFMINLDLRPEVLDRVERYVSKFESSDDSEDLSDSRYLIEQIRPSFRKVYLDRLEVLAGKPSVTNFRVDTKTTSERNIEVSFTFDGRATEYMISEDQNFAGANWTPITTGEKAKITIGNVAGNYTVYFKVRNPHNESDTVSDTLEFIPKPFGLAGIIINNNDSDTYNNAIQVSFEVDGIETPSHYRIGLIEDLSSESWIEYSDTVEYLLPTESYGDNIVYAQVKLENNTESLVKSSSINYIQKKIIISKATGWDDPNIGFDESSRINICRWDSTGSSFPLKYNDGTIFSQTKLTARKVQSSSKITAPEGSPYPGNLVANAGLWNYKLEENIVTTINIPIPDDKLYTVKIYYYTSNSSYTSEEDRLLSYYKIGEVTKNPPTFPYNNLDQYVVFEDVTAVDGKVTLEVTGGRDFLLVFVNIIEVIPQN